MIGVRIIFKSYEYLYKETQELKVSYHKIMVNIELKPESSSKGVLGKSLPASRDRHTVREKFPVENIGKQAAMTLLYLWRDIGVAVHTCVCQSKILPLNPQIILPRKDSRPVFSKG